MAEARWLLVSKDNYYYYRIWCDPASQRIPITKQELYDSSNITAPRIAKAYQERKDNLTDEEQQEINRLLAIAWTCLGGVTPLIRNLIKKPMKDDCPHLSQHLREEYESNYLVEFFSRLRLFNRESGNWVSYVRLARKAAIKSTFRAYGKDKRQAEIRSIVRTATMHDDNVDDFGYYEDFYNLKQYVEYDDECNVGITDKARGMSDENY